MSELKGNLITLEEKREEQITGVMEKFAAAAHGGAVYSEPITIGAHTIITASEIAAGGGFGSGFNTAVPAPVRANQTEHAASPVPTGTAGGMGGGGGSSGRPVAIIVVGPEGVTVQPIIDITKIALRGITLGGVLLMLLRKLLRTRT